MTKRIDSHHECHCNTRTPAVELKEIMAGESGILSPARHKVIFIIEGAVNVSIANGKTKERLTGGDFIFLPIGVRLSYRVEAKSVVLLARMIESTPECHLFRANKMHDLHQDRSSHICKLCSDEHMALFTQSLAGTLRSGMKCEHYLHAKAREFTYLLYAYYTEEDRDKFFSLIASADVKFSEAVRMHLEKTLCIAEIANEMSMCTHTFAKKIKNIFGVSPKKWIDDLRSEQVYKALCQSNRTIKGIIHEYGFSRYSNFTRYCWKNYGQSPGEIRKNLEK